MIFRQRYFGTFVSGGFIVMAYAKGGVPSPFFRSFFNATGKGTRFRKQEKYDVGFFCRYRTFPIFLFFPFLPLIRERWTLEPVKWDKRLIRKLSLPFYFFLEKNTFFLKSLRQVFHVWKM